MKYDMKNDKLRGQRDMATDQQYEAEKKYAELAEKALTLIAEAFQHERWVEVYRHANTLMSYAAHSVEADYKEIKAAEGL